MGRSVSFVLELLARADDLDRRYALVVRPAVVAHLAGKSIKPRDDGNDDDEFRSVRQRGCTALKAGSA